MFWPLEAIFLSASFPKRMQRTISVLKLAKLNCEPMVVFTTAFDQYALDAFKVNSIDRLSRQTD
jgi:DNA-binding LytR/AlgR family response regulator